MTEVAGFPIASNSPYFLSALTVHVVVALGSVICGAIAMLSQKRSGRHPLFGTIYYWLLAVVFASATLLSLMRWREDYYLFILGGVAFTLATVGRLARRHLWAWWAITHVTCMGMSYVVLLTAFYVDNGANLPVWRLLPHITYWLAPSIVGIPLIVRALVRHRELMRLGARSATYLT